MAYQLASDISYINELNVKVDFIKTIPENVREMFSYITGKPYRLEEYEKFTYEMMDWYKERLVLPHDITQMLIGYRYYTMNSGVITRFRQEKKPKNLTRGIVIARSIYDFYTQSMGTKED